MTRATSLALPGFSQMTHRGHHPEWGGGGEAWCSPTSVAMVLRYFGTGPKKADYSWTKGADGQVYEVDLGEVESRKPDLSAMPEGLATSLSREDLRDLIEYVATR